MDFTEKEITALRKESVQKKNNNIYAPYIYVADERLEFTMQDIIEPYVRMMLPKTFLNLPSAIAKQMYPSEFRPAVIKTNPSLTVNFAFTFFEEKLPMKEVPDCAHYYHNVMKKMYPGNRFLKSGKRYMDPEETRILGWYSFVNPTATEPIYNIHAFTSVEERMLYCIFHTSKERFPAWEPHAFEVFDSITTGRRKANESGQN